MSFLLSQIPVAILAGGLATRLRPITEKIPKSLVPVAGRPILAHQLEMLHAQGIRHAVLCIFMNDAVVSGALARTPHSVDESFGLSVALGLSAERHTAARTLQRSGVIVLDVPAERLSIAAVDEYLRIKSRALL